MATPPTNRRFNQDIILITVIVVMAVSTFCFFKGFFDATPTPDPYTTEILAALLGSIFTVMITMLLIRHQGTIERALETAATSKNIVFERKLELFRQFISVYTNAASDGKLDDDELAQLEELALTISLFTRDVPIGPDLEDLGEEVCRFVLQLELFGLKEEISESEHELFDQSLARPRPKKQASPNSQANRHPPTRQLGSFVEILRLMKIDLGVAQSDTDEVDDEFVDFEQYEWTRRLLRFRGHKGRRARQMNEQRAKSP